MERTRIPSTHTNLLEQFYYLPKTTNVTNTRAISFLIAALRLAIVYFWLTAISYFGRCPFLETGLMTRIVGKPTILQHFLLSFPDIVWKTAVLLSAFIAIVSWVFLAASANIHLSGEDLETCFSQSLGTDLVLEQSVDGETI